MKPKIHIVHTEGQDKPRLVRAYTKLGARNFVIGEIRPTIRASVPTQDELVAALQDGIQVEDAIGAGMTEEGRSGGVAAEIEEGAL